MKNVVFLDVDGVLNNTYTRDTAPSGYAGVEPKLIKNLAKLVENTHSVIVLSSTWKMDWEREISKCKVDGIYLQNMLAEQGVFIVDKIEDIDRNMGKRGEAINKYLDDHPEIEHYVVLDDDKFEFSKFPRVMEHFVHTDYNSGFTERCLKIALDIMQNK